LQSVFPAIRNRTRLAIAIAQTLAITHAEAATILVNDSGDISSGQGCTLREAIQGINQQSLSGLSGCAVSGAPFDTDDQINFSVAGVNIRNGKLGLYRSLRIEGGQKGVMISGNGSSSLLFIAILNSTVTLNKLSLTGGAGGAMQAYGGTITLSNSTVSGNSSHRGGGIVVGSDAGYTSKTVVNIINSSISGNTSSAGGGGIFLYSNSSAELNIHDSTISGNTSGSYGGGILVDHGSLLRIPEVRLNLFNSTVSGNFSGPGPGGGIFMRGSTVVLSNSTVSNNSTNSSGGGIAMSNTGGPAWPDTPGSLTLSNSTISENSGLFYGGNVYFWGDNTAVLSNTIIANSVMRADCRNTGTTIFANSDSIIEDGSCGTVALKVNPKLGPLKDNGGPTKTHALLPGSPAINAGNNAQCATDPVNNKDQRGELRPAGGRCDIGAYEFGAASSVFVIPLPGGKSVIFSL